MSTIISRRWFVVALVVLVVLSVGCGGAGGQLPWSDDFSDPASGWQVSASQEKDTDGKVTKHVLTAVQEFAPGQPLPGVDGDPGDPDRSLYVQYPTTVTVDQRDDGTYYHFRRVYPARSFAQVNAFDDLPGRQRIEKIQENLLRFGTEEFDNLDPDMQRRVEGTIQKMEGDYGYCQHCAKDAISYLLKKMTSS